MVQTKWSSRTNTLLTSLFIIYQTSMEHIGENISICVKGCNLQSVGETVVTIWGLTQLSLWKWCTIWIKWNSDEILKHGGNLINYWWHLKLQKPTCYEVDRKHELVNYFWIVEQDWREPTYYKSRCPWISEVFSSTEHWKQWTSVIFSVILESSMISWSIRKSRLSISSFILGFIWIFYEEMTVWLLIVI